MKAHIINTGISVLVGGFIFNAVDVFGYAVSLTHDHSEFQILNEKLDLLIRLAGG